MWNDVFPFFLSFTVGAVCFFAGRKTATTKVIVSEDLAQTRENQLISALLKASVRDDGLVAGASEMALILKEHFSIMGVSLFLLNERGKPQLLHSSLPAQGELQNLIADFLTRDTAGEIRCWNDARPAGFQAGTRYMFIIRLQAEDHTIGVVAFQHSAGGELDAAPEAFFQVISSALARGLWVLVKQEELRINSLVDPLTGALNKRALLTEGPGLFKRSRTSHLPVSVAIFDIDRFKGINDTYGHPFGDVVLRTFAERLMELFRNEDLLFRYGGEEFVLILPGCPLPRAHERLQHFRGLCKDRPIMGMDIAVTVTASCGLTLLLDEDSLDSVLQRADKLLYLAKEDGRDGYIRMEIKNSEQRP